MTALPTGFSPPFLSAELAAEASFPVTLTVEGVPVLNGDRLRTVIASHGFAILTNVLTDEECKEYETSFARDLKR